MPEQRFGFAKTQRLRKKTEFDAVFAHRQRAFAGPLGMYVLVNGLAVSRLGISISRKVGTAARRNRIKRLLRESFRLLQHQIPSGWDLVIVPKPHEPLALPKYQQLLAELVQRTISRT